MCVYVVCAVTRPHVEVRGQLGGSSYIALSEGTVKVPNQITAWVERKVY